MPSQARSRCSQTISLSTWTQCAIATKSVLFAQEHSRRLALTLSRLSGLCDLVRCTGIYNFWMCTSLTKPSSCFFSLLVEFLGGERSLIISLAGRPPTPHSFPLNFCLPPVDMSDPFSFLSVKRGILQYTQVKPALAFITMILKATGSYSEGTLKANNGYTYLSVVYNVSITIALYSLLLFWQTTHTDLKPFRPLPKFICIKGLLFMTFWQGFAISILVSAKAIKVPGYTSDDAALAISDALICCEMPIFALLHLYSFSHMDYVDTTLQHAGRLPLSYAIRDSLFGYRDVLHDSLVTIRGQGFSYSTFESSESAVHAGAARANRIRAGLRYANGGKQKYWLPLPGEASRDREPAQKTWKAFLRHPLDGLQSAFEESRTLEQGYSSLTAAQADGLVHDDPRIDLPGPSARPHRHFDLADSDNSSLEFDEPEATEEDLYKDARQLEFGDWNNPVLDATKEEARRRRRAEEDEAIFGPGSDLRDKGKKAVQNPVSMFPATRQRAEARGKGKNTLPEGCVDLVVEDPAAEEEVAEYERAKGDVTALAGKERKVWKQLFEEDEHHAAAAGPSSQSAPIQVTLDDRSPDQEDVVNPSQQSEESVVLAEEVPPPKVSPSWLPGGSLPSWPYV